jgi:hypothetical protein
MSGRLRKIAVEEAFSIPEIADLLIDIGRSPTLSLDKTFLDPVYRQGLRLHKRTVREDLIDVETHRMAEMDRLGIVMQILSLSSPGVQMFDADTTRAIALYLFGGTARRCTDIKMIFSHDGRTMPFLVHRFISIATPQQKGSRRQLYRRGAEEVLLRRGTDPERGADGRTRQAGDAAADAVRQRPSVRHVDALCRSAEGIRPQPGRAHAIYRGNAEKSLPRFA